MMESRNLSIKRTNGGKTKKYLVNLKNYSFSWNLFPASAAEGRVLTDMINNLRIDSLPKRALKGLALTYPYEFHLRINIYLKWVCCKLICLYMSCNFFF